MVFRDQPAKVYSRIETRERGPLAQEIFEFRRAVGMKRSDLARRMFTYDQVIFCWECGHHEPSRSMWAHFVRIRRNYRQKLRRQEPTV